MGRFFKLATICFLTLVRRSIKFIATQQVILFRRPPWAFPPLTWAASILAALFFRTLRGCLCLFTAVILVVKEFIQKPIEIFEDRLTSLELA